MIFAIGLVLLGQARALKLKTIDRLIFQYQYPFSKEKNNYVFQIW